MEKKDLNRVIWVDYLKATACIAVVIFHVIYGLQNAGIYTHTYLNILKDFCDMFQIPLFMMASGYLYGIQNKKEPYFKFIRKKIINLGIPYIIFSIVYFLINTIFASSVNFSYGLDTLFMLPIRPIAQYWFLFALIWIFIIAALLELLIKNEYVIFTIFLIWKLLAINMFIFGTVDYYIAGYAVFFYFGVLYARKSNIFKPLKSKLAYAMAGVYLILFGVFELINITNIKVLDISRLVLNMLGITVFMLIFEMHVNKRGPLLINVVSKYSFQIYLLHTMATSAIRIILVKIGIFNDLVHFILGMTVGIVLPVIAAWICNRITVLNIFFYPISTYKKLKS